MNGSEILLIYAVACLFGWIICGICCAAIGSSFWWGFWFGPIGIVIAAVRVNGQNANKRPQIVVINGGSARRRVRIRRPGEDRGEVETSPRARLNQPQPETEMARFERIFAAGQAAAAKRRQ
jgi:hypothetical protein